MGENNLQFSSENHAIIMRFSYLLKTYYIFDTIIMRILKTNKNLS